MAFAVCKIAINFRICGFVIGLILKSFNCPNILQCIHSLTL